MVAYRVTHPQRNVAVVAIDVADRTTWEQWFLLTSDHHWDNPKCDRQLLKKHHDEAVDREAGILSVGDLYCAMQGKYDKRSNKSAVRPEHNVGNYLDALVSTAADWYGPYAHNYIVMSQGNHECVDGETEVLTEHGWKPIAEVTEDSLVYSLHPITQEVHLSHPLKTHCYDYEGQMIRIVHRNVDMMVTPNHRIAYISQNAGNLRYMEARDVLPAGGQVLSVPTSGRSNREELESLSDDEIRLAAWILTDGTLSGGASIFQSKPAMVERIRGILQRLGVAFSENVREQLVASIMGRELKKPPKPQYSFRILSSSVGLVRKLLPGGKYLLPPWVNELSQRQFDIFLEELILGDGSRHKLQKTAAMLYGKEEFLSQVQAICTINGYRAHLSWRNRTKPQGRQAGYWCLNITPRAVVAVHGRYAQKVDFSGKVYCLTTPSGNFFARRNGKAYLTGNSAIKKNHETDLCERLVAVLNDRHGSQVQAGGYGGWVRFLFKVGTQRSSVNLKYFHGAGGGGPVTKGVIQTNRRAVFLPDAHVVVSGHVHESWQVELPRERLNIQGRTFIDNQLHICTATYKEEYGDGHDGWHVERGAPPKPLGAWWLRFFWQNDRVDYEVIRAK